jgi:hydroxymethylpyrimidine/phosphomethylpyrimidine kinase
MENTHSSIPVVMCFSGLDPTGGAGIQADIEAITSMGCHPAPIVTALTVQDTQALMRFEACDPLLLVEQARAVLEDMPVQAFKLGMLANTAIIEAIHSVLIDYPDIPVVFDPVLSAGAGGTLIEDGAIDALRTLLLPQTSVLTPNSIEARTLAPTADTLTACAEALQDMGCEFVLITGTHEQTEDVTNTLYGNHRELEQFHYARLPHQYHGSGCTLAASIAGLLAQGLEPFTAIHEAQTYTWDALRQAYRVGMGQLIPNRLFWARDQESDD